MDSILMFIIVVTVIYFFITWALPKILSWMFTLKYKFKVTIGQVKFPKLKLKNILITKNGFSVHIEEIGISSNLFNSEVTKLIAITIHDVRINKIRPVSEVDEIATTNNDDIFENIKLPSSIITLGQFLFIQLVNISAVWAGKSGWLIQATASEIKLEGGSVSPQGTRAVVLSITVRQTNMRLRRRAAPDHIDLVELAHDMNANVTLTSRWPPEKLHVAVHRPRCIINEELLEYIQNNPHIESHTELEARPFPKYVVPKNCTISIDDVSIQSVLAGRNDLNISLKSFEMNSRCNGMFETPANLLLYFALQLDSFRMDSCRQSIFALNKLSLDAKVQSKVINLYVFLHTLKIIFDKSLWPSLPQNGTVQERRDSSKTKSTLLTDWTIQACGELWAACSTFTNGTSLRCYHTKLMVEHAESMFSVELLLETFCWAATAAVDFSDARRCHLTGTIVFLSVALLKLSHSPQYARLDAMLDVFRIEWSSVLKYFLHNSVFTKSSHGGRSNQSLIPFPEIWTINIALSNVNLFFIEEESVYIATRLDSITVEGCETKSSIEFSGCKLVDLDTNTQMFMCTRSEEMTKTSCSVKSCRFDRTCRLNTKSEWSIDIANRLDLKWNPVFHLKMVTIIRSFIKSDISQSQQVSQSVQNKWSVRIARLCFIGHTGNHELRLDLVNGHIKGPSLRIKAVTCCFTFDNASVITAQSLNLQKLISHPELKEERLAADGFVKADNEAWLFSLAVFEARFPYKHSFADAVQNELVAIIKWLKKVHNKQKVPFTLDSPLPRDLLIKINDCLFEMADDPFEVRLRDNYELLQDEYNESLKRQQMLDSRLTELLRTHLLLPAGKVEELYANLSKKNGEIYIQRSKQISLAGPARTRLLAWHSVGVSIAALADLSLHGSERVLNFIRGVDPASPWPADGLTCTTLWTRQISVSIEHSTVSLRDFPQPFVEARRLRMWGRLAGAEQIPPPRSVRNVTLDLPPPWEPATIERGMTQLKFYHDINLEMDHYSYAFGPCWEPVIAQCNLSMEQIIAPSRDPSPPLPFWDKMRLLLHGRLTMLTHHMTVLLHASLDPYNTTEEMELAWHDMVLDWTNAKIVIKGDLDVYVRTASKYDDCQLLHLPNIKLVIKLDWVCLADANDHHSVVPCAPDRVPEYSSNNQHDSYRAFRSQHIDASVSLDARGRSLGEGVLDGPTLLLYGSTLRWFESLQLILSGVTRPTRRGLLFGPKRPRRIPLSRMPLELIDFVYRHYRTVRLLFTLQHFQASYWMSCAMQRGCELLGIRAVCGSEHTLTLVPTADGLLRRPRAAWSVGYMNCELTDAEVWLKSALRSDTRVDTPESSSSDDESPLPVEKCYFLSVAKVSYGRETPVLADNKDTPTHKLVVYDLKGAWTKRNRDVAFALFDAFVKSQQLKKNLSAEALRLVDAAAGTENSSTDTDLEIEPTSPPEEAGSSHQLSAASMLRQLIAEAEHKNVVFSDDQSPAGRQPQLRGLQACQQDDVLHKNWSIALVNSQVVLRGCETKGYVILSAAKAEILQRVHGPAIPKRTWVGSLECLQYYATVCPADEDIMWLPVEHIQERARSGESTTGPASVVGSGRAAGGVVSEVVGAAGRQLQRIVSRCRCEFFYVSYGSGDSASSGAPQSDAFTLMHHDLDVCTNSLQYGVLLDVINSLILWVEPARKEAAARLARLRFQLQLQSDGGVRVPVQKLQTQVRTLLGALRRLERDAHLAGASPAGQRLRAQLLELKQELGARAEELQMLLAIHRGSAPHSTMRTSEICFKHAQWRLTDADGQLGIADLVLSNFLYTKKSKSDDSVEHLLELGYVHMTNLLPNQVYTEVLSPTEIQRDMPVDHKHVLRVFCRERPPVGGISVKEHFEINVVPITIGLTKKFYNTMLKFCFPERDDPDAMQSKVSKDTSFYVRIDRKDDVEKMKERAEKNKLFIYIKIPEVPVRVSYKGNKDKNIEDVRDFSLVIPTLEYHNVTWTWLDLLLAMKSDTRRVILSQAIKQKLQLHRGGRSSSQIGAPSDGPGIPQEEDKARMLLGKRPLPQNK